MPDWVGRLAVQVVCTGRAGLAHDEQVILQWDEMRLLAPTVLTLHRRLISTRPRLVLEAGQGAGLSVSTAWLRDHCRHPDRYSAATNQRTTDLAGAGLDVGVASHTLTGDRLVVRWEDGGESEYSLDWVRQNCAPNKAGSGTAQLWSQCKDLPGSIMEAVLGGQVGWAAYTGSQCGPVRLLESLLRWGVASVVAAPAHSQAGTRAATETLFPLMISLSALCSDHGSVQRTSSAAELWEFGNSGGVLGASSDSSYSDLGLATHTDGTYMTEAPGLQVFHCLAEAEAGGETVLVDGWSVAARLKEQRPAEFAMLAGLPLPSEYLHRDQHATVHLHTADTVFKFRYNTYDRAPLNTVPAHQLDSFYQALSCLEQEMENEEHQVRLRLQPGTVLFVDNWRVGHGRTAFTGRRVMSGCYVARQEWRSAARTRGLLPDHYS